MTEKKYWLYLAHVNALESRRRSMLLEIFGSPEEIYRADRSELEKVMLLEETHINQLVNSRSIDFEAELDRMEKMNIKFVSVDDDIFPEKLREIPDCPHYLFYKGKLPKENTPSVAIIGSRKCSTYGMEMGMFFAEKLSECGVQIISGMAAGVDGYAHRGAVRAGGDTFGILGSGVDICFPKENRDIYDFMCENGGVVSEYYPGRSPIPLNFPQRNRLISGFSDCILVAEARKKSGTSITVGQALEQGREVFAVPGRLEDPVSDGCNELIRNGAKIATSPNDILMELRSQYEALLKEIKIKNKKLIKNLDCDEKIVYACLRLLPKHFGELQNETGFSAEKLSVILVNLQLKNYAAEAGKNSYIKTVRR